MGDYADDIVDEGFANWGWPGYHADEEDEAHWTDADYFGPNRFRRGPRMDIKCRHCGERGFHWERGIGGWRLYATGSKKPHVCYTKAVKQNTQKLPTWVPRETRRFMIQAYVDSFI